MYYPFPTNIVFSSSSGVPNSKVHRANMGPIWGRQDPDGPHIGPMNFAIWGGIRCSHSPTSRSSYRISQ